MSSKSLVNPSAHKIFGIDEAGRGPLVGPVVAACVYIPPSVADLSFWFGVTDSKKLSAKKRDILFAQIIEHCPHGIAEASAKEVDDLNIHHATLLAMKRAYEALGDPGDHHVLVDGKFVPDIQCSAEAVVKGDSKHVQIAAASILAKVTRDRLLAKMHEEYPHYNWIKNSGYGTKEHLDGIAAHGISPYHRLSFSPCKKYAA